MWVRLRCVCVLRAAQRRAVQLDGMLAGYNAAAAPGQSLALMDLLLQNAMGDTGDIDASLHVAAHGGGRGAAHARVSVYVCV